MWGDRLQRLSTRDKWVRAFYALIIILCAAWIVSGILTPAPWDAKLHRQAGGPRSTNHPAAVAQPISLVAAQVFKKLSPAEALAANAMVPVSTLPNPPAEPFKFTSSDPNDRARATACLALAVYYEAGNQGPDGEAAVAQVVLNRLRHPFFPKTICGVVFEGSALDTGCQFTFTCDGSLRRRASDAGWKEASQVADRALDGYVQKAVGEATHYHTVWVVPYWQSSVVKLAQIGAHIFYRWPGGLGAPAAFHGQYAGAEPTPPSVHGFDIGLPPVILAKLDDQPPAALPYPPAATVAAAPTGRPVEVAMLAAPMATAAPALSDVTPPPPEKPRGFFGRGDANAQRLPIAGHW
jgi:spore germination cell wall hydrolase CwlJ-like protein